MTGYSIIIPAFNEAALIADTLRYLLQDQVPSPQRVTVICNGCSDDTAARARAFVGVTVIELAQGGKANAINHGLNHAPPGPVFVMDADIAMRMAGFDQMVQSLLSGTADAVSPVPHFISDESSPTVRRFFRIYTLHPYLARGVGGAGIWGLSQRGREQIGRLPPLISDDGYVRAIFPAERQQRITLPRTIGPLVRTPRTYADLLRCETRWRSGDAEIAQLLPTIASNVADARFRFVDALRLIGRNWTHPVSVAQYVAVKAAGRIGLTGNRVRGRHRLWHRDESSRAVSKNAASKECAQP